MTCNCGMRMLAIYQLVGPCQPPAPQYMYQPTWRCIACPNQAPVPPEGLVEWCREILQMAFTNQLERR